jgi:hypothetical protein
MKKNMGVIVSLFSLWAGVSSVQATLITDNFNRSGIGYSSNAAAALVNANWTNGVGQTAQWAVTGPNKLLTKTTNGAGYAALVNKALETLSGSGKSFTLSADLMPLQANNWAGVVWGYQDASNYYFLQMKANTNIMQVYKVVNGTQSKIGSDGLASANFAIGGTNTVTITSTTAYNFDVKITNKGTGATLLSTTSRTDTNSSFTGGYAGLILTTPGSDSRFAFDNFSLQVIPEPATVGLLGGGALALLLMRRVWWRK